MLVTCTQLSHSPSLGRCPPGAGAAEIVPDFARSRTLAHSGADTVWPAATLTAAAVDRLPVQNLVLDTDGSVAAIERARTILEHAYPELNLPATVAESNAQRVDAKLEAAYKQLVAVVILSSLVVAGCSLAVSVVTGLTDRKRPFSLLRLAGAPLTMLRRVVVMESAVPLLILAVVSLATGFVAAALFLDAQLDESLQAPGAAFWITVLAGIVGSLAVTASTLPMLERMTGPETARNE
jgi:predicted lysophospholipase L1 biosynthesis ABC-type transport system permease subunit